MLLNRVKLGAEIKTSVKVQIPTLSRPFVGLERSVFSNHLSTLQESEELRVSIMHGDEVRVLVHQIQDGGILLFVGGVERFYRNLRKAQQIGELVLFRLEVISFVKGEG